MSRKDEVEYERSYTAAWRAYVAATTPAWLEYKRVDESARAQLDRAVLAVQTRYADAIAEG